MHALDLAAAHPTLHAYSLHPGVIGTKLLREGFGRVRGASVSDGAQTSIGLATGTLAAPSGSYLSDGVVTPCASSALDAEVRLALQAETRRLVGLTP